MEQHSSIISLKEKMPVEFHEIEEGVQCEIERGVRKYDRYSKYIKEAVIYANSKNAAILNLCPDAIFSDSTFTTLVNLIRHGKRLVCMPGLRIKKEEALELLAKIKSSKKGCRDSEIIDAALEILHPITESMIWGNKAFNWDWPSHIIHRLQAGLLIYPFHTHPLYLNSKNKGLAPVSTLDDDYINSAFDELDETGYLINSNEGFCFELSEDTNTTKKEHIVPTDPVQSIASWTNRHCNKRHLINFNSPYLLNSKEISGQDKNVIRDAKDLAENIMNLRSSKKKGLFSFFKKNV